MSGILRRLPVFLVSIVALVLIFASFTGLGLGLDLDLGLVPEAHAYPSPDDPPTGDADADAEARDKEARALYLEGENDYAAGRYEMAAAKFARAYELSERPALLFNMANAYERMGAYEEAVRHLERYLESPKVEDVVSIRERIKRLRATIAANHATGATDTVGTTGSATDARPDARSDAGGQDPGGHGEADVSRPPVPSDTSTKSEPLPPVLDARTEDQDPGPGIERLDVPADRERHGGGSRTRWSAYALLGTSGVAVASTVFFGLASRGAAADAAEYCNPSGESSLCLDAAQGALERERRYAWLADVSAATAVAAAGVGLYLWLRQGERAEPARATTTLGPVIWSDGFGVGVAGAL